MFIEKKKKKKRRRKKYICKTEEGEEGKRERRDLRVPVHACISEKLCLFAYIR